jgi:hypothetical protein
MKDKGLYLKVAFPQLRRWQVSQPLHKLHEVEAPNSAKKFHEEVTGAPTASQLGGHPPRLTSLRYPNRTNHNGKLNMQG